MSAPDPGATELLKLTQRLLESIVNSDWATYEQLCDPSLTAFEPEALGHLVEGLAFHRFYFELPGTKVLRHQTMSDPKVRVIGDVGIVTYVRLIQRAGAEGRGPVTGGYEETRVWHCQNGIWRHVHFHRSPIGRTE